MTVSNALTATNPTLGGTITLNTGSILANASSNGSVVVSSLMWAPTNVGTSFPTLTFNTNGVGTTGTASYSGPATNDFLVQVTMTTGGVGLNPVPLFTNTFCGVYSRTCSVVPFFVNSHASGNQNSHGFYFWSLSTSNFVFAPTSALGAGNTDIVGFQIYH